MKTDVLSFLRLAILFGVASGLTVGPVRLINNQSYITYSLGPSPNRSLIKCPYNLDGGEEVKRVYWEMWDDADQVGTYEWLTGSGGQAATGRLEGVVELNRDDGGLELTKLRYDLGGSYLCGVELTNGQEKSDKEEVLIVDIIGDSWEGTHVRECNITSSYKSPAVFPEPTLRAGMFSKELDQFYDEINSWSKVVYPNGSVTYSYNNVTFKIDEESPEGVALKVALGVTKTDGKYISLLDMYSTRPSWNKHGCPHVKEQDHKEVRYWPWNKACRGGYKDTTEATMTCQYGYRPAGAVSKVVMRCNGTSLTWQPEEGQTANTFEDLQCVKDNGNNGNNGNNGDNGNNGNNGNTAVFSSGSPSLALLFASFFSVVLRLGFCRP